MEESNYKEEIAKILIDIAGKPFISRQLNYLSDQGIKDIVICVGHLGDQIKDYIIKLLQDGQRQINLEVTII